MGYWVKAVLGFGLFLAGVAAFEYGLYELMQTGTCASGGPYVSARPCPEGTAEKALLLPGGLIVGGIGIVVFALRGRRPGASEDSRRASAVVIGWATLFIGTGVVALVAGLGADGPDAGTAQWVGIFLAAMFIPMGLVPVLFVLIGGSSLRRWRRRRLAQPGPAAPAPVRPPAPRPPAPATPPTPTPPTTPPRPAPETSGDPVERLRKLGELRDAGVLTAAEFDAAKSRILAEL